jgi:nucleoid DNA-binding protein
MKQAKRTIAAKIAEKTGLSAYRSKKAVQAALDCVKQALGMGKQVDLEQLGRLVIVTRQPSRKIINKLKGQKSQTIRDVHKKHPKTVRLLGRRRDLSENPRPTVVHKKPAPLPKPPRSRHFTIAMPSWRRFR